MPVDETAPTEDIQKCLNCPYSECWNCLDPRAAEPRIDHQQFMALYDAGWRDTDIATHFDLTRQSIQAYRTKHNIPANKLNGITDDEFRTFYAEGLTYQKIADITGLNPNTIAQQFHRLGLKRRVHTTARDRINLEEFMALYRQGTPDKALAVHFGVSRTTIWRYRQHQQLPAN